MLPYGFLAVVLLFPPTTNRSRLPILFARNLPGHVIQSYPNLSSRAFRLSARDLSAASTYSRRVGAPHLVVEMRRCSPFQVNSQSLTSRSYFYFSTEVRHISIRTELDPQVAARNAVCSPLYVKNQSLASFLLHQHLFLLCQNESYKPKPSENA